MGAKNIAAIVFGLGATLGSATAQADVVFSDSDFALANYSAIGFLSPNVGSLIVLQTTTGGNPGNALQTSFRTLGAYSLQAGVIRNSFVYDPATSGAIESIDVSIDRIGTRAPSTFLTYVFRPLVYQNGFYYQAQSAPSDALDNAGDNIWVTMLMNGLSAANFVLYNFSDGTTNANLHPDFGAAMTFGFVSITSNGAAAQSGETRNDNWMVRINTVPEPGTLMLLGLGLAGVAAIRRRRSH